MYLKRDTLANLVDMDAWKYLISIMTGVADKETLSTLSTSAIVKGESEMVEEIFPEATLIDHKGSSRPENKIEQTAKVVQVRQL